MSEYYFYDQVHGSPLKAWSKGLLSHLHFFSLRVGWKSSELFNRHPGDMNKQVNLLLIEDKVSGSVTNLSIEWSGRKIAF